MLVQVHLADWANLVAAYNFWHYRREAYANIATFLAARGHAQYVKFVRQNRFFHYRMSSQHYALAEHASNTTHCEASEHHSRTGLSRIESPTHLQLHS